MPNLQLKIDGLIETLNREFTAELAKAGIDSFSSFSNFKNLNINKLLDALYLQICYITIDILTRDNVEAQNDAEDASPYEIQIKIMEGLLAYIDKNAGFSGLSGRIKKQILDGFLRSSSASNFPEKIKKSTDILIPHEDRYSKYYKNPKARAAHAFEVLVATSPSAITDSLHGVNRASIAKRKIDSVAAKDVQLDMDLILRHEREYGTVGMLSPGSYYEDGTYHTVNDDSPLTTQSTQSEVPSRRTSLIHSPIERPASAAAVDTMKPQPRSSRRFPLGSTLSRGLMRGLYRTKSSGGSELHTPTFVEVPRLDLSADVINDYKEVINNLKELIKAQQEYLTNFELSNSEFSVRLEAINIRLNRLPENIMTDSIGSTRLLTGIMQELTDLAKDVNLVIRERQKETLRLIQQQTAINNDEHAHRSYTQKFLDLVHKAIASLKRLFNSIKEYFGFTSEPEDEQYSLHESSPVFLPAKNAQRRVVNEDLQSKHNVRPQPIS